MREFSFLFLTFFLLIFTPENAHAQTRGIEESGDVLQIALPLAAFGSTFIWHDDQKPTWQFVKAMAVSTVLTHGLKRIINKERPNGGKYSFPSGHTSAAFTGAGVLKRRFGWKVGVPAYLLAGYVGWTRVHANKHDYWDVLGGAVIGIGSAYLFTKPYLTEKLAVSVGKLNRGIVMNLEYSF